MNNRRIFLYLIIAFLCLTSVTSVQAHMVNQSYVYLKVFQDSISGRFEITLKDLNSVLGEKFSDATPIDEVMPHLDEIKTYYSNHVSFYLGDQEIPYDFGSIALLPTGGRTGTFAQLDFYLQLPGSVPDEIDINYTVLFDELPNHVGLGLIEYNWEAGIYNNESLPSLFFDADNTEGTFDLTDGSILTGFIGLVKEGTWHIWIGIDHILFLLALILPAVIIRNGQPINRSTAYASVLPVRIDQINDMYLPVERFRPAFIYVVKIVTFFTISHTVTLCLAALNIIVLPSRLIESIIAFSIGLAALHNVVPIFKGREWILTFGFGLFHGFGFASVLSNIQSGEYLGWTLFGFNLGVEIGQLVVISIIFPILYVIRKFKMYNYIIVFGSALLILISLYWFIERSLDIDIKLLRFINNTFQSVFG